MWSEIYNFGLVSFNLVLFSVNPVSTTCLFWFNVVSKTRWFRVGAIMISGRSDYDFRSLQLYRMLVFVTRTANYLAHYSSSADKERRLLIPTDTQGNKRSHFSSTFAQVVAYKNKDPDFWCEIRECVLNHTQVNKENCACFSLYGCILRRGFLYKGVEPR